VVVFGMVIFMAERGPDMIRLHQHSESTTGEVVAIDRANHMATTIRYQVRGVGYERRFPQRSGFRVGGQVSVFYDPGNPMRVATENPADGLWALLSRSLLGGAFLSVGIVFMMSFPRSRLFRPIIPFWITPRIFATGVLLCTVVETFDLSSGRVAGKIWVSSLVALLGSGLLTAQAFRIPNNAGWRAFAKSRLFLPGARYSRGDH
jgi:hypothetical protein